MPKADEYRRYAQEAMVSARNATSDDVRKQFLDLAKMWMTAAHQTDDGMTVPISPDAAGDTTH
jgi:hypothetical protein